MKVKFTVWQILNRWNYLGSIYRTSLSFYRLLYMILYLPSYSIKSNSYDDIYTELIDKFRAYDEKILNVF